MHHVICLPPSGLPRGQSLGKVTQEEVDREGGGGGEGMHDEAQIKSALGATFPQDIKFGH